MKNSIYLITLALFFVFGCKEEPASSINTGRPNTTAQASNDPTLSVSSNPHPGTVNAPVTVTGSVAENISGTTAKVQLYQAYDSDPDSDTHASPVGCDYAGTITWVKVAQSDAGVGSVSYSWTPTTAGHYGFRAHLVKGNSSYDNLISNCSNLDVSATTSCSPAVTISSSRTEVGYSLGDGQSLTRIRSHGRSALVMKR